MQEVDTATSENSDSDKSDSENTKPPQLLEIELRVLGALMEKQLTTPDAYPLTLNSLIAACNQKSSREPVSNYHQGEIARALQELQDRNFVRCERGSRSDKYDQQFSNQLGLGKKQQALLCVMMLRGPQTVSELNTRTKRMCDFVDKEDLELCIERLSEREVPFALRLGQQPGQRGERIAHLFAGKPIVATTTAAPRSADVHATPEPHASAPQHNETLESLKSEMASLNQKVNALSSENSDLKQQIETLYELTGHSTSK